MLVAAILRSLPGIWMLSLISTMERKSVIYELRKELRELQNICPHFSAEHNFAMVEGYCPYCGKKLEEVRNDKGY